MNFEFATAARVIFGPGQRRELFDIVPRLGNRALLVTGANPARAEWARAELIKRGVQVSAFAFETEPQISRVEEGRKVAESFGPAVVIAIGGGSVIDGAKAIAALAANAGDIFSYLEVIGRGQPLEHKSLPVVAVPTTAGTGAEVTRNSVIVSPEHQVKVSLRSPSMLPLVAIIDPELTLALPPALTACTGMDALTQVIEPFLSCRANPLADGLCREAIPRIARALPQAFRSGQDLAARTEMALGSLFGGMALANAGLGAVHGFAAPVGGMFTAAPHGAVCAALLPGVMAANHRALLERTPSSPVLQRFEELGALLIGIPKAGARDAIAWVRQLTDDLGIPRLGAYGIRQEHVPVLCERAAQASSMKANPIRLSQDELSTILSGAL